MNHASQSARDKWRQIIQAQRASGLTITGYCRRHGIAAATLYVWNQRLARETFEPAFVQVQSTAAGQPAAREDAAGHAAVIEVYLGGGRRLRVGGDSITICWPKWWACWRVWHDRPALAGRLGPGFPAADLAGCSWRKPGFDQKGDHTVVQVSWNDAKAFCDWLAKKSGKSVVLPTDAQWEYACRAGTKTAYPWGDHPDDGKGCANCGDQSLAKKFPGNAIGTLIFSWDDGYVFTSPVGSFRANAFGLYDMIGNVRQWCQDGQYYDYGKSAVTDPTGTNKNHDNICHFLRGGSWGDTPPRCRSACRFWYIADDGGGELMGFRVVVTGVD